MLFSKFLFLTFRLAIDAKLLHQVLTCFGEILRPSKGDEKFSIPSKGDEKNST